MTLWQNFEIRLCSINNRLCLVQRTTCAKCKHSDSYDTVRCLHSCAAILIYESKIRSMEWIVVKVYASYTQFSAEDELTWSP